MNRQFFIGILGVFSLFISFLLTSACGGEELKALRFNELLAKSESQDDWLELYNPTDKSITLTGMRLKDSSNIWEFPEGSTISANGYLQVICDDSGKNGNTNFKLSSKGETITLSTATGEYIDKITYPAQTVEISWGRVPDGKGAWKALKNPTPGKTNGL